MAREGEGRGGWHELKYMAEFRENPTQAAGAQCCTMDIGEDDGQAPAAGRPAPLVEVRPHLWYERHCGSGFELVLDVTVPQLGKEVVEVPKIESHPLFSAAFLEWCRGTDLQRSLLGQGSSACRAWSARVSRSHFLVGINFERFQGLGDASLSLSLFALRVTLGDSGRFLLRP